MQMVDRIELHEKLCDILGSRNVYYQPPESVKLAYPAIVYSLRDIRKHTANNGGYMLVPCYETILIDKNPDSKFVAQLVELPYSSFNRSYVADNLNHFVFTIYHH